MSESSSVPRRGILASLGPAIITASVVLGPGSILSASKIGHEYGYALAWVLCLAVGLMFGMTALSARLGVMLDGTLCDELASRAGRPIAALAGIVLFLIAACFQFSNNLGVLAAIEPFYDSKNVWLPVTAVVGLNVVIVIALYGFKHLYQPAERLMKFLVGVMILGFAGNLLLARPNLLELLAGLVPQLPDPSTGEGAAAASAGVVDKLQPAIAMFATTFSVAAAFYQSYLVRQKGWTRSDLKQGMTDSAVGIVMLGLITMMVMTTAAAVLHNNPGVPTLSSAGDVAKQLEPAFGPGAKILFCMGIFAGAFSSFLVNAMIGGSILSDGLGLGGYLDQKWPKLFTVLGLGIGMCVALVILFTGQRPVNLIIFAQAMTVLGLPILAAAILWLATRSDLVGERWIPMWMKVIGGIGLVVTILLAGRTAFSLWEKMAG